MKRTPTRSVPLISIKGYSSLAAYPGIGGKEFTKFLENLPNVLTKNSRALILCLSHLNIGKQHQDYLKILQDHLENEFKPYSGHIFSAQHGDIICIYESASKTLLKPIAEKVRSFFSEDVFTKDSENEKQFYYSFNLSKDYKKFLTSINKIIKTQEGYLTPTITDKWIRGATRHISPLSPTKYKEVCDKLAKNDISKCIRSQPICRFSKIYPEIEARELYVHIAELQKAISPNVDLLTDPWLFQSLTYYLDRTVLTELNNPRTKYGHEKLNLNLNISSLLSDEFLSWDQKRSGKQRQGDTIELQKMDIFADMGAYQYIREFLHSRGYKICLDGLTHMTLPFIDWKRLKVDRIKLYWSAEMAYVSSLSSIGDKIDPSQIILAHCEDPEAIVWGKKNNIELFQGWHVDQLLMPGYTQPNEK